MPNPRTGSVFAEGKWWVARVTFVDARTGKRRDRKAKCKTKLAAIRTRNKWLAELDASGPGAFDGRTFAQLADYYEKNYAKPAVLVDGKKIAGLKGWKKVHGYVKVFRDFFEDVPLRRIDAEMLQELQEHLATTPLEQPHDDKTHRSFATINRYFQWLHRMFVIAEDKGWIVKNPMGRVDTFISIKSEEGREVVWSHEEEAAILAKCTGKRSHLVPMIILLADTGMRVGEAVKLTWQNVFFDANLLFPKATITKTERSRKVAMTARLRAELEKLHATRISDEARIFGLKDSPHTAFNGAKDDAGIDGITLRDLRATFIVESLRSGMDVAEVARIVGHTSIQTTLRYVKLVDDLAQRGAKALDRSRAKRKRRDSKAAAGRTVSPAATP